MSKQITKNSLITSLFLAFWTWVWSVQETYKIHIKFGKSGSPPPNKLPFIIICQIWQIQARPWFHFHNTTHCRDVKVCILQSQEIPSEARWSPSVARPINGAKRGEKHLGVCGVAVSPPTWPRGSASEILKILVLPDAQKLLFQVDFLLEFW